MAFEVRLEKFDGPLHVLLELIQAQELPITEISLAQVTEGYLRYIETQEVPPSELADFLIVATKLLLIKSQAILPVAQGVFEDDSSKRPLQSRLH